MFIVMENNAKTGEENPYLISLEAKVFSLFKTKGAAFSYAEFLARNNPTLSYFVLQVIAETAEVKTIACQELEAA